MKNHFYIPYPGNKRKEMKGLYPYLNFTNIDIIVEPYTGSCAVINYISTQKQGFAYILNDINIYLKAPEYVQSDTHRKIFLQRPHRQQHDTSTFKPRNAPKRAHLAEHSVSYCLQAPTSSLFEL